MKTRPRRRRTALVLAAVVLVGSVMVWATLSRIQDTGQDAADEEAANYADTVLMDSLDEAADTTNGDRLEAVGAALRQEPASSYFVIAGRASGPTVPVVVYFHWDDRSFSEGMPTTPDFGTACRVLTVTETDVTTGRVECPATTPDHPFHDYGPTLGPGEEMRFPDDMELCDHDEGEVRC